MCLPREDGTGIWVCNGCRRNTHASCLGVGALTSGRVPHFGGNHAQRAVVDEHAHPAANGPRVHGSPACNARRRGAQSQQRCALHPDGLRWLAVAGAILATIIAAHPAAIIPAALQSPPPPAVHSASPAGRFAGVGHRLRCDGGSRPRLRTSRRARARRIPPSRTLIAPPLPGTASWRPRQALGASCCGLHARDACRQDRRNPSRLWASVEGASNLKRDGR